jgi:hypothetical protein
MSWILPLSWKGDIMSIKMDEVIILSVPESTEKKLECGVVFLVNFYILYYFPWALDTVYLDEFLL